MSAETEQQAGPEVLAVGRFRISQENGMVWASARTNTCERCQSCDCGDEPVTRAVPAAMVQMLMTLQQGTGKAKRRLKGAFGGGPDGN